jgi:hypothetical protein
MPRQVQTNLHPVVVENDPEECPICLHACHPTEAGNHYQQDFVDRVFRCPRSQCGRAFIARYKRTGRNTSNGPVYELEERFPVTFKISELGDIVKQISPDFVAIFAEAQKAEQSGWKLICGPGYRKALEFLIKDHVIRLHAAADTDTPEKKAEAAAKAGAIKKLNLAKCIREYVADERVKQVAARAVWLGNDETHYLRKWEDKDLRDLKNLIALTVHWIEMDKMTQDALADMPAGR